MSVFLLDVNVLLALAWSNHEQHEAAHAWCARQRRFRWASCPTTQSAFIRISMQPAIVKRNLSGPDALELLVQNLKRPGHEFWIEDRPIEEVLGTFRARLVGHQQVTDACLLSLAIRHKGKLATFDQGVLALLAPDTSEIQHVAIIPAAAGRIRK
jgi:toxin-antitoxin system PIN domain toxin